MYQFIKTISTYNYYKDIVLTHWYCQWRLSILRMKNLQICHQRSPFWVILLMTRFLTTNFSPFIKLIRFKLIDFPYFNDLRSQEMRMARYLREICWHKLTTFALTSTFFLFALTFWRLTFFIFFFSHKKNFSAVENLSDDNSEWC